MALTDRIGDLVDHQDSLDTLTVAMTVALGAGDFARMVALCDRIKAEIEAGPQPAVVLCGDCHRPLDDIDLDLHNGLCSVCSLDHPELAGGGLTDGGA